MQAEKVEPETTSATCLTIRSRIARRTAPEIGRSLLVERLERIGDERELFGPMTIDR